MHGIPRKAYAAFLQGIYEKVSKAAVMLARTDILRTKTLRRSRSEKVSKAAVMLARTDILRAKTLRRSRSEKVRKNNGAIGDVGGLDYE